MGSDPPNLGALRENIADVQHAIWSHWMGYLFTVAVKNEDGSATLPAEYVRRWSAQMRASYSELSQDERESDREQADRVLKALAEWEGN
jgi:hypothetical protein